MFGNDLVDMFCLPAVERINQYMAEVIAAAETTATTTSDVSMATEGGKATKRRYTFLFFFFSFSFSPVSVLVDILFCNNKKNTI